MRQENVGAIAKTNRRRQRLFSSCVFIGALGMTATASAVDGCKALLVATVYASVKLLLPQPSSNLINGYIDGALSNQVRW
jgi:hypothetical protein